MLHFFSKKKHLYHDGPLLPKFNFQCRKGEITFFQCLPARGIYGALGMSSLFLSLWTKTPVNWEKDSTWFIQVSLAIILSLDATGNPREL